MRAVLEFGESHPGCDGVAPPSPNSSSGDVTQRELVLRANQAYQKELLVRPGVRADPVADPVAADDVPIQSPTTTYYIIICIVRQ